MSSDGPVRDCRCRYARHEHGDLGAYTQDRCRCGRCRAAATKDAKLRQLARSCGRPHNLLPADQLRGHIESLLTTMTLADIERSCGVKATTIKTILARKQEHVSRSTYEALMSCSGTGTRRVDSGGTVLRLRALVSVGWTVPLIAESLDVPTKTVTRLVSGEVSTVRPEVAGAARRLYDALWDLGPPAGTPTERAVRSRAVNHARSRGWPLPLDLDDDQLDLPGYAPSKTWRRA